MQPVYLYRQKYYVSDFPRISNHLTISMRQQCWILIKNCTAWYITYQTYKATSKKNDQVIIEPMDSWKEKCASEAAVFKEKNKST